MLNPLLLRPLTKALYLLALVPLKHIVLVSLSLVLLAAQFAPYGAQWVDMDLIENLSLEETESEKKEKEKELEEEKEKFAQYQYSSTQTSGLERSDCRALTSMIPPAPCMEISSPPPDLS